MTVKLLIEPGGNQKHLTSVVDEITRSKRIVFVSGAGISCSAGIPDFRSMNGLYSAEIDQTSKIRGKDLFDVSLFRNADTTAMFYKFMAKLQSSTAAALPTTTHKFLRTLQERGSLLRCYTQNIDGLERRAGLTMDATLMRQNDVIQLHGNVHKLKCLLCSELFAYNDHYHAMLRLGTAPDCPLCADKCAIRVAAGRRAIAVGTLRPDIVLYGENHPEGESIAQVCSSDMKKRPDCLIIAGTSLKVPGCKKLIKDFAKVVHEQKGMVIFVNVADVATSEWASTIDLHIQSTSDGFVDLIRHFRPSFFSKQSTLDFTSKKRSFTSPKSAQDGNPQKSCTGAKIQFVSAVKKGLQVSEKEDHSDIGINCNLRVLRSLSQVANQLGRDSDVRYRPVMSQKENTLSRKRCNTEACLDLHLNARECARQCI